MRKIKTNSLQAGVAQINITPPVGIELSGWGFGPSVGILDDLYAKALVLSDGKEKVLLLTTDLISIDAQYVAEIRQQIESNLDIKTENILISSSHTHSGPAAVFLRRWGDIDEDWIKVLKQQLSGLAIMADSSLQKAQIGVGIGYVDNIGDNRAQKDGPIDPQVGVIRIDDYLGNIRAVLLNFSCHPVALHNYKNLISADFPGVATRLLQKAYDDKITALYTSGAGGDINPLNFAQRDLSLPLSQKYGNTLGYEALKTIEQIQTSPYAEIHSQIQKVKLPLSPLPDASQLQNTIEQKQKELEELSATKAPYHEIMYVSMHLEWAKEALNIKQNRPEQKEITVELQALCLSDTVLLALPAEVFVNIGLNIKKTSPFFRTFIIGYANGCVGYFPTAKAFSMDRYEATIAPKVYGIYSFTPQIEKIIQDSSFSLLSSIYEKMV